MPSIDSHITRVGRLLVSVCLSGFLLSLFSVCPLGGGPGAPLSQPFLGEWSHPSRHASLSLEGCRPVSNAIPLGDESRWLSLLSEALESMTLLTL